MFIIVCLPGAGDVCTDMASAVDNVVIGSVFEDDASVLCSVVVDTKTSSGIIRFSISLIYWMISNCATAHNEFCYQRNTYRNWRLKWYK